MKRTLAFIAALLMCASVFASCGSDNGGNTADTTAANAADTTTAPEETETDRSQIKDTLPEFNYDGGSFQLLVGDNMIQEVMSHEQNGDVINDALYESTTAVEERFNVYIEPVLFPAATSTHQAECRNWIMAGDDVFDLTTIHDLSAAQLSLEGLCVNVYDIPHLDFSMPWWPEKMIDTMTFMDQMYIFSSAMGLRGLSQTRVMYFNNEILNDYGIDDPYQTVFDGDWTMDYFSSVVKGVYDDVNGNGEKDDEDLYGYIFNGSFYAYLEAFGVETMLKKDDGLELNANTPRMLEAVEKQYDLLFNNEGARFVFGAKADNKNTRADFFAAERLLFCYEALQRAVNEFRHTDVDYGILPMPKLNEQDETYTAACSERPFFVPITNPDLEVTGIIIEAMSAEGYKRNFPVYYEVALKDKFLSDENSAKMLDLIYENTLLSFSYMYEKNAAGFNQTFSKLFNIENPSKDFASYYAANEAAGLARIEEIETAFLELANR